MFKDYKIPIAFLILTLIIIFGIKIQAQSDKLPLFAGKQFNNSWTPANLPIDTTDNYVYFYGEAPETKVAKDSGGVSVRPYMRVWTDSADIVLYGTFDDSTGWEMKPTWTISGGTANYDGTGATQGLAATNGEVIKGQIYQLSFKILNADSARIAFRCGELTANYLAFGSYSNYAWYGAGNHQVNLEANSLAQGKLIIMATVLGGGVSFSIDSVFLPSVIDSTSGYTHTLGRANTDTTTYYYSQSVTWKQKDGDWVWIAAETDTVTVYPYVAPPVTTNYLVFKDGSSKIVFKNKVDAIKFKD